MRTLEVEALPLKGIFKHRFTLPPRSDVTLPLTAGRLEVFSSGEEPFGCNGATVVGKCSVAENVNQLKLENIGTETLHLVLTPPAAPSEFQKPTTFSPSRQALPTFSTEKPLWVDFLQDGDERSAILEVPQSGLYQLTTAGLLSTNCALQAPVGGVIEEDNASKGRGRNCLLASYLKKGRYLFAARTNAPSKGRAGLVATRQPSLEVSAIAVGSDAFFQVPAGTLVQQAIKISKPGEYALATMTLGDAQLACRLEDRDGWPLQAVPSSCTLAPQLKAGTYRWIQLPLSVDSQRSSRLSIPPSPLTLAGNQKHRIDFFNWYRADLGSDGQDEFEFSVSATTSVNLVLTNGMQGRVSQLIDGQPKVLEVIPPQETQEAEAASAPGENPEEVSGDESGDANDQPEAESESESDENSEMNARPVVEAAAPRGEIALEATAAPAVPMGHSMLLEPGRYALTTEHSRGDAVVSYQIHLGADAMSPGMSRTLEVPVRIPLTIPESGLVRLLTQGETDVRCRLFQKGALRAETSHNGADWNCGLIQALPSGDYEVVIEAETQKRGRATVSVSMPKPNSVQPLVDGAAITLSEVPQDFTVEAFDGVQAVALKSTGGAVGCSIERTGQLLAQLTETRDCTYVVRTGATPFRVRIWSIRGTTTLRTQLKKLTITTEGRDLLPGQAIQVTPERAGRFKTSSQLRCLPQNETGVFAWCGNEVSLEQKPYVFAGDLAQKTPLNLEKIAAPYNLPISSALTRYPLLQSLESSSASIFTLESRGVSGAPTPQCQFDGSAAHEISGNTCFAASTLSTQALARISAATDAPVPVSTTFKRWTLGPSRPLLPGPLQASASTQAQTFSLPKGWSHTSLILQPDSTAIFFNEKMEPTRACRSLRGQVRLCASQQNGGTLLLQSAQPTSGQLLSLDGPPENSTLLGLIERRPRALVDDLLLVPAAPTQRLLKIEGADQCHVRTSDGVAYASCEVTIGSTLGAEIALRTHEPWRALIQNFPLQTKRDDTTALRLNLGLVPGAALSPSSSVALSGSKLDRTLVVDKPTAVQLKSSSGVCGLFKEATLLATDGLGRGCELNVFLPAGTYRAVVRSFADELLSGTLSRVDTQSAPLTEGVGAERVAAPGFSQVFSFKVAQRSKVGLGLQSSSEFFSCNLSTENGTFVQAGCHQYLTLEPGIYLFTVQNPSSVGAMVRSYKPVVFGLKDNSNQIPEDYLKTFFRTLGSH
jgi:hypothetical protein